MTLSEALEKLVAQTKCLGIRVRIILFAQLASPQSPTANFVSFEEHLFFWPTTFLDLDLDDFLLP